MNATADPTVTWLLFCQWRGARQRMEFICLADAERIGMLVSIRRERWNIFATGTLLGQPFRLEARSRRRLDGDERDSAVPLFSGTFNHQEGVSGEFTIAPRNHGELMTLGVLGAAPLIRVDKIWAENSISPVQVHGIPEVDLRFEQRHSYRYELSIPKNEIPSPPGARHYVGRCRAPRISFGKTPPMISVLATLAIVYDELLTQHYLRDLV
jgi:hypothetical protein